MICILGFFNLVDLSKSYLRIQHIGMEKLVYKMCFIQYGKLLYNTKDTLPFMTTLSFIYNFRCLIFYYWYIYVAI